MLIDYVYILLLCVDLCVYLCIAGAYVYHITSLFIWFICFELVACCCIDICVRLYSEYQLICLCFDFCIMVWLKYHNVCMYDYVFGCRIVFLSASLASGLEFVYDYRFICIPILY